MPVTVTMLATFTGDPPWGVSMDSAGDLLGATSGDIYEITYADGSYASTPTTLADQSANAPLVMDANGDLFWTNYDDQVLELSYVDGSYTSTPSAPFTYNAGNSFLTANQLNAGVAIDAAGDLFVTSAADAAQSSNGAIIEIPYADGAYGTATTLYSFTDGQSPAGSLTIDAADDIFGVTNGAVGGSETPGDGSGTVYELPYTGGSYASAPITLATFGYDTYPEGPLTLDAAGDIFGVTDPREEGNVQPPSTIFEIPKISTGYGPVTTIASFPGVFQLFGGFYIDSSGNIFGANESEVFEIAKTSTGYADPVAIATFGSDTEPVDLTSAPYADGRDDLFVTAEAEEAHAGEDDEIIEISGIPCYCRGTLILTDRGDRPVEELAIGDRVVTVSGAAKPIRWIGRRAYNGRFIRGNRNVLPVVIAAGALGNGAPTRDLWVSPEHAVYIDRLLVPAKLLVNGMTITQAEAVDSVEYFHIELDAHDVILAEGMPAETYLDCGNRLMFRNAAACPDKPETDRPYAVRIGEGFAAQGIRRRLLARAIALGHRLTTDPGFYLIVDGVAVTPKAIGDGTYRLSLRRSPSEIWLASRSAVAAETDAASRDRRRLGVSLRRIVLRGSNWAFDLPLDSPQLREGFHPHEGNHRWTDGMARLPAGMLALLRGKVEIEIALWPSQLRYVEPAVLKSQNVADIGSPKFARAA
jgi:hypothetical protein